MYKEETVKFFCHTFSRRRNKIILSIILIIIVTFVAFSSSLNNGFTNWDDRKFVTKNYLIRDISWNNTKTIFATFYKEDYRYPLVILSYSLEYHFFRLNPFIYHLNNLILHILNTLLVFFMVLVLLNSMGTAPILRFANPPIPPLPKGGIKGGFINRDSPHTIHDSRFTKHLSPALITALFFGVHPLHVESVVWISERKGLLSAFFLLQTIIYYNMYKKKERSCYYGLSLVALMLSFLSKAIAVTAPFILLLCDYLACRRFDRKTLLEKAPFFVLSSMFGAINLFMYKTTGQINSSELFSFFDNLLIVLRSIILYLTNTLIPLNLSAFYPYPRVVSVFMLEFFLPLILLPILTIALFYSGRYTRKVMFGSLFFLINILPVIKLVHFESGGTFMADRYMYIPSIGLFFMLGLGFQRVYNWGGSFERVKRLTSVVILCVVIVIFSVLTYQRNNIWQDSETLWKDVLDNYPDAHAAHDNLGDAYTDQHRFDEAIREYQIALQLKPDYVESHNGLGYVYYVQDRFDEAIREYQTALQLKPDYAKTYLNLGLAYAEKGMLDETIKGLRMAVRLENSIPEYHYNLGLAYANKGFLDDAIKEYRKALSLNPKYSDVYNNLGFVYEKKGLLDKAIEEYSRAIGLNPNNPNFYYNIGNVYANKGLPNKAIEQYRKVLRLDSNNLEALYNVAVLLENIGDKEGAVANYRKFIEIAPLSSKPFVVRAKERIRQLERY